jgi:hypothetical protein
MKYILVEKNTLSRLTTHLENGFVCISASRGTLSPQENKYRTKKLKEEIQLLQLGYWQTKGGYLEEPPADSVDQSHIEVFEDSFLVPYSKDYAISFDEFVNMMADLGNMFDQDAILVKPQGSASAYFLYLNQSENAGQKENLGSNISVSKAVQFFTQLKSGKRFVVTESNKPNFKLYFESPSSSFEAQSFSIRKQHWLT